ncbi:predicted protein [Coccidioides posadasii str. Silveira]|uniref:Predicted protein n=1 Tax=Coccidioides posadasii (strain RMSCC 757 / Silveira) TaxID=443226 RepID=E9DJC9_COCPS|nr:predicted protein [Coccidioides posadasii str. Silveira]
MTLGGREGVRSTCEVDASLSSLSRIRTPALSRIITPAPKAIAFSHGSNVPGSRSPSGQAKLVVRQSVLVEMAFAPEELINPSMIVISFRANRFTARKKACNARVVSLALAVAVVVCC